MKNTARHGGKRWLYWTAFVVLFAGYFLYATLRSITIPGSITKVAAKPLPDTKSLLIWPKSQSAVGVLNSQILDSSGTQSAVPTASVAKVITALTVLEKYPLRQGEQGPTITLGAKDIDLYNSYAAKDGSLVKVQAGEKLTEYQILQAIMLPSSNNLADSLAIWAFGSLKDYSIAANDYVRRNGLSSTQVGSDASGLSPTTKSTAKDLVKLGVLAMNNPVLSEIASQPTANNFPLEGTIKNVNFLLGTNGIVGIKTGNSDEAGGVYLSASKMKVEGKPVTIIAAVTGSQSLFSAMKENLVLTQSAQKNIQPETYANAGYPVGGYQLPWGGSAIVVVTDNLTVQAWGGSQPSATLNLDQINNKTKPSQNVGQVSVTQPGISSKKSAPVHLQSPMPQPSIWWRLIHPS